MGKKTSVVTVPEFTLSIGFIGFCKKLQSQFWFLMNG